VRASEAWAAYIRSGCPAAVDAVHQPAEYGIYRQRVTLSPRRFAKPLSQQFDGSIEEVAPQVSRFRHQAGDVRAVDHQRYLRRDAVGITDAKLGDYEVW
jgi:hypothetical protein